MTTKATGHNLTHKEKKDATCTEDGNIEYWYCENCKKYYSDENGKTEISEDELTTKATGHNLTHKEKKDATCTEDGNVEYWHCENCGKYYNDGNGKTEILKDKLIIAATGHAYEAEYKWSENGKSCQITLTCKNNEKHKVTGACTVTSAVKTDATCEEKGTTTYTAEYSYEGKKYTATKEIEDIPAGHKLTHIRAQKPTNSKTGNIAYYQCSGCDTCFSDAEGKTEIEKDYWVIPQKSITVNLGNSVKIEKIMDGATKIKKMALPKSKASKCKKYLTVNSKTGTIKTKKYYKTKLEKSIPVKVTTLAGGTYTVNVKVVIPAPKVTIKRKSIKIRGVKAYRYTIKYNVKGASKLNVEVVSGSVKSGTRKDMNKYFSKVFNKSKGTVTFNIVESALKRKKIKYKIKAVYGKNQSQAATIEK